MKQLVYWTLFPFRLVAALAVLVAWVLIIVAELVESKVL